MFEKFNGTPLWVIKLLTMQRVEYQVDGPLTQLARDALGLGDVSGSPSGWTRRRPITRRSVSGRTTSISRTSPRPRTGRRQTSSVSGP